MKHVLAGVCFIAVLGLSGVGCGGIEPDPDLAYHRALNAMDDGRWDWARVYFENDLETNPDRLDSIYLSGVAWISGQGGGLGKGSEYFELYLQRAPTDVAAAQQLIKTFLTLGEPERAQPYLSILDDSAASHTEQALAVIDSDPEAAYDSAKRAITVDPDYANGHIVAAQSAEALGRFDLAMIHATRAAALDPFHRKAFSQLARLWKMRGDHDQEQRALEGLDLASAMVQSRDAAKLSPAEELRILEQIKAGPGGDGFAFRRRYAQTLLEAGRTAEGVAESKLLEGDQRLNATDKLRFAKYLFSRGRAHLARDIYHEILETDPDNSTAVSSLALLELSLGNRTEARRIVEAGLENLPYLARYHAALAKIEESEGRIEAAVDSLTQALHLAPWAFRWRLDLIAIHRAGGDADAIVRLLEQAPEFHPALEPIARRYDCIDRVAAVSRTTGIGGEIPYIHTPDGPVDVSQDDWFVDIAPEVGLDFVQYDGRSGERYYVETTASGCGFMDHDGDGDLDIYLLTGAPTPGSPEGPTPRNALYENRGDHFVEITESAGVDDDGYGMGMCSGDIDGDGLIDFYIANYGADRLYRNLGGGRFEEIAQQAALVDEGWSSNCAFADLDGDRDQDLYVSHYLDFHYHENIFCGDRSLNISAYCRPSVFEGVSDSLWINQGNGVFEEQGAERGIKQGRFEKGFGVITTDIDADGDLDLFVANDSTPNRLYINDGTGFFSEEALLRGLAVSSEGMATSGMGADIGDVDDDGDFDIVLTNYAMEANILYRNLGGASFSDDARSTGLAAVSLSQVGWGVRMFDFDNDGDLDLAVANGHVVDNIDLFEPTTTYPQRNQLLRNDGDGNFEDVSDLAGSGFGSLRVSRALAVGDWNNDGKLDLLIANTNDRFELLENRVETTNHWLGLSLHGPSWNPLAIGSRVILTAGELVQIREVRSGASFQSQSDLRLHFGLGDHDGAVDFEVHWPDGTILNGELSTFDRYTEIQYEASR